MSFWKRLKNSFYTDEEIGNMINNFSITDIMNDILIMMGVIVGTILDILINIILLPGVIIRFIKSTK